MIKLPSFDNLYLFVARRVDQQAIAFGQVAEVAVEQYRLLDQQRVNVQRAFAIMYAIITLTLLLSAIWIGLAFANRLVQPIRRLIDATDEVSAGNLYVQVPTQRSEGDIGRLGQTFNAMIAEIRTQQNRLVASSNALDRRRQFTEAVLSGVSVGVIGLSEGGIIAIANPVADRILGGSLSGRQLATVAPEINALFEEAKASRSRGLQRQVEMRLGGRDMTLFVRVTSEQAVAGDRGYVITLDDITDLVTAQRTSAWADVARRIAHEIKNPLTPIQLSAERIRGATAASSPRTALSSTNARTRSSARSTTSAAWWTNSRPSRGCRSRRPSATTSSTCCARRSSSCGSPMPGSSSATTCRRRRSSRSSTAA